MPPEQPVPTSVRRARILERIQQVGGASLAELAAEHAVSTITVHRDLEQLSRDGLVVRFHGGAFALAHRLEEEPAEDLTIVTTSPAIALGLDAGTARVIVAPGEVDLRMRAIADGWTVDFLRRITVDTAFVSGTGFDLEHGLTTARRPLADALVAVRASADRVVALVDASKLGRAAMVSMIAAADLDAIVVDAGAD